MDKNKNLDLDLDDDFDEIDLNDSNAEKLVDKFEGCTHYLEYKCPCGKGSIVEERVVGFGDYCALIKCKKCEKKYNIITGCGHFWELEEK